MITVNHGKDAPDFFLELEAGARFAGPVAGVDEAGRGPWAGPVVAAAVVLTPGAIPAGLNDSKKLTAMRRAALFDAIAAAGDVGIGVVSVEIIDRVNILQAALMAMGRAVAALPRKPASALIDGLACPRLGCPAQVVVRGDQRSLSIAAASIVAKVTRDRLMADLAVDFPGYGWERNKGYGTPAHAAALGRLGVTPHHRRSFAPVRAALLRDLSDGGREV